MDHFKRGGKMRGLFTFLLIFFKVSMFASDWVQGEILVILNNNVKGSAYDNFISSYSDYELNEIEIISPRLNLIHLGFNNDKISAREFLLIISNDQRVDFAQLNHYYTPEEGEFTEYNPNDSENGPNRNNPNDPNLEFQWALNNTGQKVDKTIGTKGADIRAFDAWAYMREFPKDYRNQRSPVVAVLDTGFMLNHPDLNGQFLPGENTYNNSQPIPIDNHGTFVSGIINAISNNGIGVSGIGGGIVDIKVMPIYPYTFEPGTLTCNRLLEAYSYVLEKRITYNSSNGTDGYYIVATNQSFGGNYNPNNFLASKKLLDEMGKAGIISVMAAGNSKENLNNVNLVPQKLETEYKIVVAGTNQNDGRYSDSNYGSLTVDLGAPGTNIVSTAVTYEYAYWEGTSFAAPYVAGVLALMYSAVPEDFLAFYDNEPGKLALLMKEHLLSNVDKISSMQNITKTGGRLNAYRAVKSLLQDPQFTISENMTLSNQIINLDRIWVIENGSTVILDNSRLIIDNVDKKLVIRNGSIVLTNGSSISLLNNGRLEILNNSKLNLTNSTLVTSPNSEIVIDGKNNGNPELRFTSNSTITINSNIEINGGVLNFENGSIILKDGAYFTGKNAKINLKSNSFMNITNGRFNVDSGSVLTSTSSTINLSSGSTASFNRSNLLMTGGGLNLKERSAVNFSNKSWFETEGNVVIKGYTSKINIEDQSSDLDLDLYSVSPIESNLIPSKYHSGDRIIFDNSFAKLRKDTVVTTSRDDNGKWDGIYFYNNTSIPDSTCSYILSDISSIQNLVISNCDVAIGRTSPDKTKITNIDSFIISKGANVYLQNAIYKNNSRGILVKDANLFTRFGTLIQKNGGYGVKLDHVSSYLDTFRCDEYGINLIGVSP